MSEKYKILYKSVGERVHKSQWQTNIKKSGYLPGGKD